MHYTDDEIFFLGVDADIISGATTGAAIIIVVTGIIIMIVIILVKKFRREEGSVEPGPESGQHVVSISTNKINDQIK